MFPSYWPFEKQPNVTVVDRRLHSLTHLVTSVGELAGDSIGAHRAIGCRQRIEALLGSDVRL